MLGRSISQLYRCSYRWLAALIVLIVAAAVITPTFGMVLKALEYSPLPHASHYVWRSTATTIFLLLSVGVLSCIVGSTAAWLIAFFEFTGKRFIRYLLMLPLAVPTYISGYVYYRHLANPSSLYPMVNWLVSKGMFAYCYNALYAVLIMTCAYYPYVYIVMLGKMHKIADVVTVSRILGYSGVRLFITISMYAARPALLLGISFVAVEVLTEYGLTNYYGLDTYVNIIYRLWFNVHKYPEAAALSSLVLMVSMVILFAETRLKGENGSIDSSHGSTLCTIKLRGIKNIGTLAYCSSFIALGFLFPVIQLLIWGWKKLEVANISRLITFAGNSIVVSSLIAFAAITVSLLVSTAVKLNNSRIVNIISKVSNIGYVIPGPIVAISVLNIWSVITGIANLLYACVYRFLGVAHGVIGMGFKQIGLDIEYVIKVYCKPGFIARMREYVPLVMSNSGMAFAIIFVDAIKELPITLITRPFNYENLATRTYELVSDERYMEAAVPSLLTIMISLAMLRFVFKRM